MNTNLNSKMGRWRLRKTNAKEETEYEIQSKGCEMPKKKVVRYDDKGLVVCIIYIKSQCNLRYSQSLRCCFAKSDIRTSEILKGDIGSNWKASLWEQAFSTGDICLNPSKAPK